MRRLPLATTVGMAAAVWAAASATDTGGLPKGPPLGDARLSVRFTGMLKDAVPYLASASGRRMSLLLPPPEDPRVAPGKGEAIVSLDFRDATLEAVLLALCRQAGVVYRCPARQEEIEIAEGDPSLDARPTTTAGEYIIRVVGAERHSARTGDLGWGALGLQTTSNRQDTLWIRLEVVPRSADAQRHLAGLETSAVAVTETGEKLETLFRKTPGSFGMEAVERRANHWGQDDVPLLSLQLSVGPIRAGKLRELEGALRLFSTVKVTQAQLTPAAVGQTVADGDVSIAVTDWKPGDGSPDVRLEITCPPLPKGYGDNSRRDRLTATLVAKDGSTRFGQLTEFGPSYEHVRKIGYRFWPEEHWHGRGRGPRGWAPPPPFVPDHMLLTIIRYGSADVSLPFVIEDIPVP